jgi:hypothetical protein
MIMAVQGTRDFDGYKVFLRAMEVALSNLPEGDKEFTIYSAGAANVNSMSLEFSNICERSLRARGIRIRTRKVSPSWLEDNIHVVDYFAFFCLKKEPASRLVREAEAKDIEVHIYQFI